MNAAMNINPTNFTTKEAIKNDLRRGIVQVVYTKLNGEVNDRRGTLNFDLIPNKDHPNGNGTPDGDSGYINYYDLTKNEWRKFHIDRLKECNILFELKTINDEYEFHTLRFKKLTYGAVSRVATEVFMAKKALTTLSLKIELRAQGYWAEQERVSQLMDEIAQKDKAWDYKQQDGETFRLYFLREEEVVTV
ncbi:MAG TPA: hypothetical protein DCS93_16900 [Microscillaceae bacterium]|nr:hypothetical protein [Microscillaceae bacterium]